MEAIVDATNAESDERIQDAVVLEPEEAKTPRVIRVTTSAGVSPIVPTMDKRTVNKAEEFIEKVANPAEVVIEKNLDFTTENIPVQELVYEMKDIFPEFEKNVVVLPNTYDYPYRMKWLEGSFGNTMTILGYKTYYTVNYQGEDVEIWYDEVDKRWNSGHFYIDELDGKLYSMNKQEITLDAPTRQVPVRGNDGVFSYNYDVDSKSWNRRAIYQIVKPNTFDFSDISENKATWRILALGGSYNWYNKTCTHCICAGTSGITFYGLKGSTFNYKFGIFNYESFEGNKKSGLWLWEIPSNNYVPTFIEKAQTNEWKTLADYPGCSIER